MRGRLTAQGPSCGFPDMGQELGFRIQGALKGSRRLVIRSYTSRITPHDLSSRMQGCRVVDLGRFASSSP